MDDYSVQSDCLEEISDYKITIRGKVRHSKVKDMATFSNWLIYNYSAFAIELYDLSAIIISFTSLDEANVEKQKANLQSMIGGYIISCTNSINENNSENDELSIFAYKKVTEDNLLYGRSDEICVPVYDENKNIQYDLNNPMPCEIPEGTEVELVIGWDCFSEHTYNCWNIESVKILKEDDLLAQNREVMNISKDIDYDYNPYKIKDFFDMENEDDKKTYAIISCILKKLKGQELFADSYSYADLLSIYCEKFRILERITKKVANNNIELCKICKERNKCKKPESSETCY